MPHRINHMNALVRSGAFDLAWYQAEAGRTFVDLAEATRHYRSTGAAMQLSPHPFFAPGAPGKQPPQLSPLASYLRRPHLWSDSPHLGWDLSAYVRAHPEAMQHAFGPLGHLAERLTTATEIDVRTLDGSRAVAWGEIAARWRDLATTWTAQRRLRVAVFARELPADHRLPETSPVRPSPETLVSVIIPTWNRSAGVQKALASVKAQSWSHWEAIVVDDGSVDDTIAMVEREAAREPRIRVIALPHQGVSAARNAGLENALGGLIAFLDSDNQWQPGFLEAMVRVMQADGLGAAYGTLETHTAEGPLYRLTQVNREMLMVANHVDLNVLVVRAALMERVGGFDPGLRRAVDYDLVLRLAEVSDLVHVPVVGVDYESDQDEADRISVREPWAYMDVVRLKHQVNWEREQRKPRDTGLVSVVLPVSEDPEAVVAQLRAVRNAFDEDRWEAIVVDSSPSRRNANRLAPILATDGRIAYKVTGTASFSYAADLGFTCTRGSTLIVLEPDAIPDSEALRAMRACAVQATGPFIAQPVTVDPDGRTICPAEGTGTSGTEPGDLAVLDGKTFVTRAEDFARARGLDALLYNELELADLSLRMRAVIPDARQVLLPSARVHAPASSARRWSSDKSAANRAVFEERHGERINLLR